MNRTMFDQGFRPGAVTLGHGEVMGSSFTDAIKKITSTIYPSQGTPATLPTSGMPPATPTFRPPEPTIMGMPQSTAMWTGAALLATGVIGAIIYSQRKG